MPIMSLTFTLSLISGNKERSVKVGNYLLDTISVRSGCIKPSLTGFSRKARFTIHQTMRTWRISSMWNVHSATRKLLGSMKRVGSVVILSVDRTS